MPSLPALFGTLLMPVSSLASWFLLFALGQTQAKPGRGGMRHPYSYLLPVAGFYWLWACKNRAFGPIWIDGGVVTFLPAVLVGLYSASHGVSDHAAPATLFSACAIAASILPMANFVMPALRFMKQRPSYAEIAKKASKPFVWGVVFYWFVWSGLVFWLCSAVVTAARAHDKLPYGVNSLAGVALGVVFMGAGKSIAGAMNAPVLARLKKERDNQA